MNLQEAREVIAAVLDQIPDRQLPQPTKVEKDSHPEYGDCHWFGSHGYYIGSCRNGKGESIPSSHRRDAIFDLFQRETMQRLENAHYAGREVSA